MTGRGEIITPLEDFDKLYLNVIKHKNLGVSTKSAYEILDKRDDFSFKGYSENLLKNPSSVNFTNDFHTPILDLYPELKSVQEKIVLSGAERVLLSGSGASIFGTYPSKQKRDAGFDTLSSDNNIDVFSCESMNRNEYKNFILGDLD